MSSYVEMLKDAFELVKSKIVYKRFIKSTPLENDIACWLVDFATEHAKAKQAEVDALKVQNAELLAAQEGTPCKHEFNAVLGGVLSCIHCYASFSEQKEAIAKARGDL